MSSSQAVAKLQAKLESLIFKEGEDWDKHVSKFLSIIDELAAQDQTLSNSEKVTKILRTLPESFASLAMASSLNQNTFEEIVNAVQANIERKKKLGTWKSSAETPGPSVNFSDGNFSQQNTNRNGRGRGHGRGRGRGCGRGGRGRGGYFNQGDARTCHYCGKRDHFIKFAACALLTKHQVAIRKPNYHNNQPNQYHNNNFQPTNNPGTQWGSHPGSSSGHQQGQQQHQGFNANIAQATQGNEEPPPHPSQSTNFFPPRQAYLVAFKSTIATVNHSKSNVSFIDSGATHNFFNNKLAFQELEEIPPQPVKIAEDVSYIVGKGKVKIILGKAITMEAYFAPDFSSNIIASHLLSDHFEVHMTSSLRNEQSCLLFKKGSLSLEDIVWETKCKNGLYPVQESNIDMTELSVSANKQEIEYRHWHDIDGHISCDRYQTLSNLVADVTSFPRSITSKLNCVPCITGKMQRLQSKALKRDILHQLKFTWTYLAHSSKVSTVTHLHYIS